MRCKSKIVLLSIIILLLAAFSVVSYAEDEVFESDIFTYSVKNNQAVIKSINNKDLKKVYIPDEIDGYPVAIIDHNVKVTYYTTFELYIPASVYDIISTSSPDTTLESLKYVSKYVVDENNEYYASDNGVLYDKNKETLYIFPRSSTIKNFETPSTVKTIFCRSMSKCNTLETVILNEGLKKIDNYAFYGAQNLKSVSFPEGLEIIGQNAFIQCKSLEKVDLPSSLKELQNSAFSECTSLKEITIPDGIKLLDIFVVADDTSLERIFLPKSVTQISLGALSNCPKLAHIYYTGTKDEWENIRINNREETLAELSGVKLHYNYSPSDSFDSVNISIQEGIMMVSGSDVIPDSKLENLFVFEENIDMVHTIVFDGVRYIGTYAFDAYPQLTNIIITNSDIYIADYAFANNNKLKYCFLFGNVKLNLNSFSGCSNSLNTFVDGTKTNTIPTGLSAVNIINYSYADSTLSFDGNVIFNRYEFFDSLSVFCSQFDSINNLKFTSFSFSDITLCYLDGEEQKPIEGNVLENAEISAYIFQYGEQKQVSFNVLIEKLSNESIADFTLVVADEKHQEVPETFFSVFKKGFLKALKWMVSIVNSLFKIIGKKK